ncbi:MAG TPA: UDP-N-acetylmuramoyl-tripeptide--D-alanyl-D-alanine ligase [Sedimenticola thiotaurini]|uniref:UDP-N-acetylmuramoyl-tripeptide--D-alanyl-D-alanine ligase n=1 Tax=Sedimenticola thiotaurini TaxID=1543721 RepID=A0A831RNY7_9GAMM|nr:UDP-N-acetylmuramoyl-tripeptide--D-alanyl-D-alanine ligase [Sedimenticola thiotaurini]
MIQHSLSDLAPALDARHIGPDASFTAVSTDTRTLRPGELFVALQGPRFDGHEHLAEAEAKGAAAVMVSRRPGVALPGLLLEDTRRGLGRLAALWRRSYRGPVVAVTGSNGKTTVKEMLAAILSRRGSVLATVGNQNNDIGLPLTLLRLQEHDHAVVELGANRPGEIDYLTRIARPDVALVNNAGPAHLEGFGSVEGVARAKGEIVNGLAADGCLVYNADDDWAGLWRELAGGRRLVGFGVNRPAEVSSPALALELAWSGQGFRSRFPVLTPAGEIDVEIALAGEHNRMNALAAIAAALVLGVDRERIREGLAGLAPVPGRLQPLAGRDGIGLIDDSYNANPASVEAAIRVLATAPGRRFLVLGPLAELGDDATRYYRHIGEAARAAGIDDLYAVGDAAAAARAFGPRGHGFVSLERLLDGLEQVLEPADRVLIKGSRSAGMERVVERLAAAGED